MAHPQGDLWKIGAEGFALIDKFYGPFRGGRGTGAFGMEEPSNAINSKEAAVHYGGIMVMNYYPNGKPQKRWGRVIKP